MTTPEDITGRLRDLSEDGHLPGGCPGPLRPLKLTPHLGLYKQNIMSCSSGRGRPSPRLADGASGEPPPGTALGIRSPHFRKHLDDDLSGQHPILSGHSFWNAASVSDYSSLTPQPVLRLPTFLPLCFPLSVLLTSTRTPFLTPAAQCRLFGPFS